MEDTTRRLAEDGVELLAESERRLEALESVCANALLEDSYAALVEACAHAVVQSARARRFQSAVVVHELAVV